MKKEITQRLLTILLMLAVLVYTFYNYQAGKFNFLYFIVFAAILLYPLIGNIIKLISDLKNQD